MARITTLRVEDGPQPVDASCRLIGGCKLRVEDSVTGVELRLLTRGQRSPGERRMRIVLDVCAQDGERRGENERFQFGEAATTGVIEAITDGSVEPLNCSTRSLSAGSSNSTILCGRGQSRDPEKSFDLMGWSPSTTSTQ